MNTFNLAYLFKDAKTHKKVEILQKIQFFGFLYVFIFLIANFSIMSKAIAEDALIGYRIAYYSLSIILFATVIYDAFLFFYIGALLRRQTLENNEDTINFDFITLEQIYTNYRKKALKQVIIIAATTFVLLLSIILLVAFDKIPEKYVAIAGGAVGVIIAVVIIVLVFLLVVQQIKLVNDIKPNMEKIRQYYIANNIIDAKKQKRDFSVYAANKAQECRFPDENIRKELQKQTMRVMIISMVFGAVYAVAAMGIGYFLREKAIPFIPLIAAVFIFGIIALSAVSMKTTYKFVKIQENTFNAEPEKYKNHILLSNHYKKSDKNSLIIISIVSVVLFVLGCIASIFKQPAFWGLIAALYIIFLLAYSIIFMIFLRVKAGKLEKIIIQQKAEELENIFEQTEKMSEQATE